MPAIAEVCALLIPCVPGLHDAPASAALFCSGQCEAQPQFIDMVAAADTEL